LLVASGVRDTVDTVVGRVDSEDHDHGLHAQTHGVLVLDVSCVDDATEP
jgi:hypothetical protein